jgi:hypothetical protein
MKLNIVTLKGNKHVIDIDENSNFFDIKKKLEEKIGIPVKLIRLIYCGREIDNSEIISTIGIQYQSNLHMVIMNKPDVESDVELDVELDVESDIESDDEKDEDEDEDEDEDLEETIFGTFESLRYSKNRTMYKVPINLLIQFKKFFRLSKYNRMINYERIEKAFTDFNFEDSDPLIFSIIGDENEFDILDGQHRMTFIMKNTHLFKGDEIVLIDVRKIDSEKDFKNLLRKINNRYNFSDEQVHKYRLHLILETLNKNFVSNIYGKNRPRINKEKFERELVNLSIYKNFKNSVEFICNKLMDLNTTLATKININKKQYKLSDKSLLKCCKMNLFIGIDKQYKILKMIDN